MTRIIYVAGPFTAPTAEGIRANIRAAAALGHIVRSLGAGALVPHLIGAPYVLEASCVQFADPFGYDWWIQETMEMLRRSDAVVLVSGWQESSGSRGEVKEAQRLGKPVFQTVAELAAWLRPSLGPEAA